MKITDIKQQVKRAGRYSIFVDEKYLFSLGELELMQSGIRIGKEYTTDALEQLKQTAILDKAYMRSLDYLARRPRSEWEIKDYLKRKEYEVTTIKAVLSKLHAQGYVNDQKFARAWVNNRRLLKPVSFRRLQQELLQKHINQDVISQVLAEDETDETQIIRELIAKKRQQTRYQDNQKLLAYLVRQGFNYGNIREVLQG